MLRYTIRERASPPLLAAVAWFVAEPFPGLALVLFFGLLAAMLSAVGLTLLLAFVHGPRRLRRPAI